jgi:ComF family protein
MFRDFWSIFLDILFPPLCVHCRQYLGAKRKSEILCGGCFNDVRLFQTIFRTDWGGRFLALGPYEDGALKDVIRHLKYQGAIGAIDPIRKWLAEYLTHVNAGGWINRETLIVPIPLHPARLRQRGFNQAELIANLISETLDLKVEAKALKRVRDTQPQATIGNKKKRADNVVDCFAANPEKSTDKPVLLVDDVYTSGATIRAAATALRKAGVREINVFVLAKT